MTWRRFVAGRSEELRGIARGGVAIVYEAVHVVGRRHVALKVLFTASFADDMSRARFLREVSAPARIGHEGIVEVFDAGFDDGDGAPFVAMELLEGHTFRHEIDRHALSLERTLTLFRGLLLPMSAAHGVSIVHRDLKPDNVLITQSAGNPDYVKVLDFGLAKIAGGDGETSGLTRTGQLFGTPAYMSPEQARGEAHRVDGRSDVFSLGVVLYELITGHKPFFCESHEELLRQILWTEPVGLCQRDASIAPELERICLKSLSKRAADRYRTAKEMADDLRHYVDLSTPERISRPSAQSGDGPLILARFAPQLPPPKIVPRGLRPFDSCDSISFLPLVPGPRDRDGLPESIRQWKIRIEQEDPEESFAVGVMYGPSGCGKSSLVRAGLLPRIATRVHTVYVEATADHTESRILKKLLRRYPELPADGGLVDCLAALRRSCRADRIAHRDA